MNASNYTLKGITMRKLQARWYTNIVLLRSQCPVAMMIQRPTIII